MAKLKVFKARMGFYDSVVAAPSQKAALEAWGARQNLFQEGLAAVTDEPEAAKAALERPGVVLRRAAGGSGSYAVDAAPPKAPAPRKARPVAKAGRARRTKTAPDRSALKTAEQHLEAAEQDNRAEAAALTRQRRALEDQLRDLDERRTKLEDAFAEKRRALQAAVDQARRAWRRKGGG